MQIETSELEAVILKACKAHEVMCKSEYDYGFQYGLEHSLYLIKSVVEDKKNASNMG